MRNHWSALVYCTFWHFTAHSANVLQNPSKLTEQPTFPYFLNTSSGPIHTQVARAAFGTQEVDSSPDFLAWLPLYRIGKCFGGKFEYSFHHPKIWSETYWNPLKLGSHPHVNYAHLNTWLEHSINSAELWKLVLTVGKPWIIIGIAARCEVGFYWRHFWAVL